MKTRLVVAGVVFLLVSSAVIGAAAGDLLIPSPEPGVEKDYDDTFRVLASNDPDPGRGSSVVQVYEYGENGTITEVNRTVVTQPVQLWDSNIQSRDALLIANESDMYQSGLHGFVQVPYRDQWTTLRDWWDGEFRILPIYTGDPSRATSNDGQYTVEVRHPNGWWNPVYNADVERVDGVTTSLIELDQEVQNVKLTLEGEGLDYGAIEEAIEGLGGSVHSIDQVACGERVVEDRRTLQD